MIRFDCAPTSESQWLQLEAAADKAGLQSAQAQAFRDLKRFALWTRGACAQEAADQLLPLSCGREVEACAKALLEGATSVFVMPAAGFELSVAEAALRLKLQLHVVLPFALPDFELLCVRAGGQGPFKLFPKRVQRVLEQASQLHFVSKEAFSSAQQLRHAAVAAPPRNSRLNSCLS